MPTRTKIKLVDLARKHQTWGWLEKIDFSPADRSSLEGFGANHELIEKLTRVASELRLFLEIDKKILNKGQVNDSLKDLNKQCRDLAEFFGAMPSQLSLLVLQNLPPSVDLRTLSDDLNDIADAAGIALVELAEEEPPDSDIPPVKLSTTSCECVAAKQVCELLKQHGFPVGYSEGENAKTPSPAQTALEIVFRYGGREDIGEAGIFKYIKQYRKGKI